MRLAASMSRTRTRVLADCLEIGVVGELDARLLDQQHLMVREIADRGQRLAVGGDHERSVWPTVWPGADMAWMPGRNSWPSLKNTMRSRLGSRFLRAPSTNGFM